MHATFKGTVAVIMMRISQSLKSVDFLFVFTLTTPAKYSSVRMSTGFLLFLCPSMQCMGTDIILYATIIRSDKISLLIWVSNAAFELDH
jgi:hypothetical protein